VLEGRVADDAVQFSTRSQQFDWKTELKPLWEQAEKKVKNDIRK
jgi:hypothetical protein